jgi:hypothetical protein
MTERREIVREFVAAAIAREGFPRGRESARDYRLRLADAAIKAMHSHGELAAVSRDRRDG